MDNNIAGYEEEIHEMVKWVSDTFPDSTVAHNSVSVGSDYNANIAYDDIKDFAYGLLNLCGCGDPDITAAAVLAYMNILDTKWQDVMHPENNQPHMQARKMMIKAFGVNYMTDDPLLQFMAYILDEYGMTEHGCSITGAWLTDYGKNCLHILRFVAKIEKWEEFTWDPPHVLHKA